METLETYLKAVVEANASDLFIIADAPITMKAEGRQVALTENKLSGDDSQSLLAGLYELAGRDMGLLASGDDDFSVSVRGLARFRVNAFRQRSTVAAVVRVVPYGIPDHHKYGIPEGIMSLANIDHGMILITGTAGSGKSTTQACIIDRINHTRSCHVITLEDPIEYLHRNDKSIVSQREIAIDTKDYLSALRACLRQAPDIIQIGEMRDPETIRAAMTAAETGHLLIATLHTRGAVNSIDRIIDSFPPEGQHQIRLQLSSVLHTVVSQQLLPGKNGDQVAAFEIMTMTDAIRSMIRDAKTAQIGNAIATGAAAGMVSMDQSILELYKAGRITKETALAYADNGEQMKRRLI